MLGGGEVGCGLVMLFIFVDIFVVANKCVMVGVFFLIM